MVPRLISDLNSSRSHASGVSQICRCARSADGIVLHVVLPGAQYIGWPAELNLVFWPAGGARLRGNRINANLDQGPAGDSRGRRGSRPSWWRERGSPSWCRPAASRHRRWTSCSTPRVMSCCPASSNTHHHFYQTLTRAHPDAINKELFPWLTALYPIWARLKPEHLRLATRLALTSCCCRDARRRPIITTSIRTGWRTRSTSRSRNARSLGIRMTVSRGSMKPQRQGRRVAAGFRRAERTRDPRRQRARVEAVP